MNYNFRNHGKPEYVEAEDSSFVEAFFRVAAIICWIGGFIIGFVLGQDAYGRFNFGLTLVYWVAFFVSGMSQLAISVALNHLHTIARNSAVTAKNSALAIVPTPIEEAKKQPVTEEPIPQGEVVESHSAAEPTEKPSVVVDRTQNRTACPICGQIQPSARKVCFKCGAKFIDAE